MSAGSNAGGGGAGADGANPFDDTTFLVIWVIGVSLIISVIVIGVVFALLGTYCKPVRKLIVKPKKGGSKRLRRAKEERRKAELDTMSDFSATDTLVDGDVGV